MKKKVLLSVFAASLFAAPVALANGELGANRTTNEAGFWANTEAPATVAEIKSENDKDLGTKSEKWTRDANKLAKGENLKVDKGQAANKAMAPKAAAGKVLPKTSAAK